MHQAIVTAWGATPKYVEVPDLPRPCADEVRIKVLATGVHRVVQSRAAGRHYSSKHLPHVPGIDGVGLTDDGEQVYFNSFAHGAMSDFINMPKSQLTPLPEGMDAVQTAGLFNPAMSSWMSLKTRIADLPRDFSILIMGATSVSGRIAAVLARQLGAKRIIGLARNKETLDSLDIDESIVVNEDVQKTDFSTLGDVDVILDYFYGPLTTHLFGSLQSKRPVQYVQTGSVSGVTEITLPGSILRSNNLTIRGTGPGAWSVEQLAAFTPELLQKLKEMPPQSIRTAKLEDVEKEWENATKERLVFVP